MKDIIMLFMAMVIINSCKFKQEDNVTSIKSSEIIGSIQNGNAFIGNAYLNQLDDGEYLNIRLYEIELEKYSIYKYEKPYTGGERLTIYFDNDEKVSANYAAYLYRDVITFREDIDSNGHFETDKGEITFTRDNKWVSFNVPVHFFSRGIPTRIWAHEL